LPFADVAAPARAGALSPNGRFAAVLQENGTVSVWDARRGVLVALFGEADQRLANIAFRPDSTSIDAVGLDGTIYRWPLFDDPLDLKGWIESAIPDDIPQFIRDGIIQNATAAAPAKE
jgi:WD40 repeat protein